MAHGASSAGQHAHATSWGAVVAISVHALVGLGLARVSRSDLHSQRALPVEVDLVAPPPEPLSPPTLPESPPPDPLPKPVVRRQAPLAVRPPPTPNQEVKPAPPSDEPIKPVFGVTQDSVVSGESAVAVPVGNTLMTKDRTLAKEAPPPLPPAPPPPEFAPVDEESVAEFPEAYFKPEPLYPELARRMGVEGKVRLKIGVDRRGNVKSVRVLEKAGYGMDEEAVKAAWKNRFKPAKRADGQPVDMLIYYNFTFRLPNR